MKLYQFIAPDEISELAVCEDDADAAETAKAWAQDMDWDGAEWRAIEQVNGYRIIVGERVDG